MRNNSVTINDKNKIRILAIGESTTDASFANGSQNAWPSQLQELLAKSGLNVKVYNEGVSGTTSAFILSEMNNLLEKYQPNIVISMIGINDVLSFPIYYKEEVRSNRVKLLISSLRIVKVINWIIVETSSFLNSKTLDYYYYRSPEINGYINNILPYAILNGVGNTEKILRIKTKDSKRISIYLLYIGKQLVKNFPLGRCTPLSLAFFKRAYEIYPNNYINLAWILRESILEDPKFCQEVSRNAIVYNRNLPASILSLMSKCLEQGKNFEFISLLKSRNLFFSENNINYTTFHYNQIQQKIFQSGAIHIAMQYPTLPISSLKELLKNNSNTIFVENRINFENALKSKRFNEIFEDHFAGNWGHATKYGNQIIAINLLPIIQNIIGHKKFNKSK